MQEGDVLGCHFVTGGKLEILYFIGEYSPMNCAKAFLIREIC